LVAHALQCVEFFRMLVGRRKRKKIGEMLAKRCRFMHWSDHDPHRKRRNVHNAVRRIEQKETAQAMKLPLLHLLSTPIDSSIIVLEWLPIDDIPPELIDHNKTAREHHMMRVPQPITGIEVFRQKVLTHHVVMRLIDPNNKDPIGDLVMANMSRVQWRQWHVVNSKHESYFEPATWVGIDENNRIKPQTPWDRVDLYITSKSTTTKARQRRLGSIEELHSYVVDDPHSTEKRAADRARSHIRLNLGNHQYNSDKVQMHSRKFNEAKKNKLSIHGSKMGLKQLADGATAVAASGVNMATSGVNAVGNLVKGSLSTGIKKAVADDGDLVGGDAVLEIVGYLPL